ncbi:FlgD immunoglobulin-like domain containing protein [Desulforapulum autotrophicum]|uniref:FlgD immunoglobulin-like domain containing protein n=1 Tax=Desulforapulum autotrophicum TaxID=2296 RepID=UPI000311C9A7|nr:FlgD immunoglobulin-like domain containing protein [Desulforapulum autotrophicum]
MAINATGNSSLDALSSSYKSTVTENDEDVLGRDAFLTMLVAQLKNQDPLNPMEGSDFSAQLAQFSQLEQLMSLNDTMEALQTNMGGGSESNVIDYVGKVVTGNVDSIEVADGTAFGGFYNIEETSDVMVSIYDEAGNEVRTLYPGQKTAGSYDFNWDGRDNTGAVVDDGSYKYTVMGNNGSGFVTVPTSVTGTVDSIVYNEGKAYLKVQGVLVDPESLVQVGSSVETERSQGSAVDYLGRKISTSMPLISYDGSSAEAANVVFEAPEKTDVTVRLFDASGQEIKSIKLAAEDVDEGQENEVVWDGTDNSGNTVDKGLYTYAVTSDSSALDVSLSENVSEIRVINGTQYLVLGNSGFLSTISAVTNVQEI